jgi:Helix-turn-helix domain
VQRLRTVITSEGVSTEIMRSNLLNEREAAEYLGLQPATLRNWRCREKGPTYHRLNRGPNGIKYAVVDLDAYLAARRHVPTVRASVEIVRGHL